LEVEKRASRLRAFFVALAVVVISALGMAWVLRARWGPVEARPMKSQNPTHATFDASDAEIRACLTALAKIDAASGTHVALTRSTATDKFLSSHDRALLSDPGNTGDVVLHALNDDGRSDVYFLFGEPLRYRIDLYVHIGPTSASATTVDVRCLKYELITGTEPDIGHAWEKNVYRDVAPTTIDEYRVLKTIAVCLGKDTLPPVATP
jgi:hypothetical protein